MVLPKKRKSILTQEERISRLKESRIKYSLMTKSKSSSLNRSEETPSITASTTARPIARSALSKTVSVPRTCIPAPRATLASAAPKASKFSENGDDDFQVDPNSLAMIKSGRITFPSNRPSISVGSSRHTIGARQSLIGRPLSRFRASIAQEPRPSLMPLGINVFEANASQRTEVSDFLNTIRSTTTTPAKPSSSNTSSFSILNSTRQRKIRFQETVIQEVRESAESAEVAAASTSIRHSPTSDNSFMPTSILSTKKSNRKAVKLGEHPIMTPRKIQFDEEEDSDEEPDKENNSNEIKNFEKIARLLSDSKTKMSDEEAARVQDAIENLQRALDLRAQSYKSPVKRVAPKPLFPVTPLGSILENFRMEESDNEKDEDEEEASREKMKKKRRSSKMKVGRRCSRGVRTEED